MRAGTPPSALLALFLVACGPPDASALFTTMQVRTVGSEQDANDAFIGVIESADDELIVALPRITDTLISDAIIARREAGVDVRVVTDVDQQSDPGVQALRDANVPLRLADGGISYFDFSLNTDVSWSSSQVLMSHAFVVADRYDILNATLAGGDTDSAVVLFQMQGEDLATDLWLEHNQVFGGSDATALTAFSAPAKSQADVNWIYPTDSDVPVEMWLGPQERVTKRVIDAVYTARKSIRIMSNELVNDGMVRAIQEKASWGFPVTAIVGPAFGTTSQPLSRVFQNEAPDVEKHRFTAATDLPTIILIDIEGGVDVMPRAFVLSHDLYSASRIYRNTEVETDQLIDGNLFVLDDDTFVRGEKPDSPLQALVDLYEDHLDRSGAF
ncbi:MAG: hypothetical protein H6737_20830 [Alphaproteobacteria bacterium]|nr:hypothetical protein [Alphaproteobacteria bacterium]